MDSRINNGGHSTKSTKPTDKRKLTRSELLDAYLSLKPMLPDALDVLDEAIKDREQWAVTLFFKYFFQLPKSTIDQNTNFDTNNFNIKDVFRFSSPTDSDEIKVYVTDEYKQLNK
ncbi:MAG: hypothetical protein RL308_963 [Bacteroidota bacterium]|jgi:hypothetical protein